MLELRGRELVQDKSSLIIADDDEREFKMVQTEKLDEGWMKDIKYITNANSSVVNSNTVTIWMRADLDDVKSKKAVAGVLETMVNKVKKIDIRLGLFLEGTKQIKYTGKGGLIELYYLYKSINNESQTVDAQEIVELAKKTSKVNLKVEDVQAYIEKLSKAQDNQKNKAEELNLVLDKSQTEPGTVLVIGGKIYPTINKKVNVNTKIIRAIIEKEFEDNHEGIEMGDTLKQDNADKFIKCNVVYLETMRQHKSQGLFQNSWKHTRSNIELLIKNPEKFTKITKGKNDYFVEFKAIIDPVSEEAITWAPLLRILSAMTGVKVTVFIEPSADKMQDDGEGTIKKFSRIVMNHKPVFYKGERQEPIGEFENLPRQTLLTLDLKVPSSWMVSASKSEYDLDNIVITDNNDHIAAEYRLNKILLEGHAATTDGVSPAGIQLNLSQLRTKNSTVVSDTAIMANLGYFQLQSEFGAYFLNINKQQTVDDVYRIENIKHDDFNAASSDSNIIVIDSFNGKTIFPVFSKEDSGNLGRRTAQKAVKYLMDYIPRFGGGLTKSKKSLNIFAVASGHLYERLMSIMITSVMKQTQSHVTFWLIDNFMSPKFKNVFLPILSAKLGFEYRLISYKWPYWLNKETVKQRTIWGYKILFLDVLFPMDLERVIFVDADQIVRTDLQQLYDMNINGAPYAYVPFCNDRPEIEGFRFWNHGYWKDHLRGKPYHISALYLVDLTVFRKLLAGDKLRAQYQQLSVDKNSLSNLDQDLPNNMQHLVPIFSLPPEWLWCETWCSSKTFKNAKTIDLCNNPMTKEKKLDVARRLLPEWTQYDNYIHSVLNKAPVKDEL
ncbi:UDP-glucose:glycoprotein glucosyltransferase [Zancudomyces culisetae]|nr:UDP-glucose:glycoprotein glucosyltransferase [Zancudomyces culisetae]|eukprot:OMH84884.1 UDP-glucose:glycoprotein glucosyltransferase [Zancudomyces culisetae]